MILFASDLDNTLIHSYKIAQRDDICVETKDGKKLSYMSPDAYGLLGEVAERCEFVPVTTRSLEQYRRINFGFVPHYAIVAHGAMLLINGELDADWVESSRQLLNEPLPSLNSDSLICDIRYVENFFVFAKSDTPSEAVYQLSSHVDTSKFLVCAVHNKIYVLPKMLTKGNAVNRLQERIKSDYTICAGDSELDLSMLSIADKQFFSNPSIIKGTDRFDFAQHILRTIKSHSLGDKI